MDRDHAAPIRVLVADDQPILHEALVDLLRESGFDVVGIAGDGQEALVMARSLSPDVILIDVRMPGVDGIEATRRIRSQMPGIRVVVLSAYEDRSLQAGAAQAGADGYVVKGTSPKVLVDLLRSTVNQD